MPIILVVEDEVAVRSIARRVLEREGFIVLEAGTAHEAIRIAETSAGTIALLLTDVVLPGITGTELCTAIRSVKPNVPVLFMSGYAAEDLQDRVAGVMDVGFVPKPFTPRDLAAAVRGALQLPEA